MIRKFQISDWMLEKFILGELDRVERDQVLIALERNQDSVPERLEKLKNSNINILDRFPKEAIARKVRSQLQSHGYREPQINTSVSKSFKSFLKEYFLERRSLQLSFAVLALALILPGQFSKVQNQTDEGVRLKGLEPHLSIYRKAGKSFEKLEDQAHVRAKDLLQLSYYTMGDSYGVILSLDGTGNVTVHLPVDSSQAIPLVPNQEVVLPNAFELDNAPRFDRFYFFVSERPFEVNQVVSLIKSLGDKNHHEKLKEKIQKGMNTFSITLMR